MRTLRTTMQLAAAAALVAAALPMSAQTFNTNLIQNPGAEAGAGAPGTGTVPVPNWTTTTGQFTAVQYGAPGFLTAGDAGPSDRGSNFFAGGASSAFSSATQSLDLSFGTSAFSGGNTAFAVSGYFGGFSSQGDYANLFIHFLDGSNTDLGSVSVGGVTAGDRSNTSGLLFRSATGFIPVGTTQAIAELQMTRLTGDYDDAYADNLSFLVRGGNSTVPEPGSLALLGTGLLGLVPVVRRKRKP